MRRESSPITWRGSGESRLAPLRGHLTTRDVQRVSGSVHSPTPVVTTPPFSDQTCTPTGSIPNSNRSHPSGAAGQTPAPSECASGTPSPSPHPHCPCPTSNAGSAPAAPAARSAPAAPAACSASDVWVVSGVMVRTRTVGPAPLMTVGSPLPRSLCTRARLSGIAGSRYSWCSRSSVAVISSSGREVNAATSNAARPAFAAASPCGTTPGSNPRAAFVSTRVPGTYATAANPLTGSNRTARPLSPSVHAIVNPPNAAAATLSGCPSISFAKSTIRPRSNGVPVIPYAAAIPPTIAADDDPSPRPCGIRFTHRNANPGTTAPSDSSPARIARTTRCDSSSATSPAPDPST